MELAEDIKSDIDELSEVGGLTEGEPVVKRRRGRPPGARNKTTDSAGQTELPPAPDPSGAGIPAKTRKKAAPKGKPTLVMTADNYADVFQALHAVPAGLTGYSGLSITDAEAKPVGEALQVCAEFYGWDFVERFGPAFMLSITIGTLELKVAKRVAAERPIVRAAKAEAKRRKQAARGKPSAQGPAEPAATVPVREDKLTSLAGTQATVAEAGLLPVL